MQENLSGLNEVGINVYIFILSLLVCRIPDSIGKDIEKACQSIYPLHDVFVRKVKMLKKPKFECKLKGHRIPEKNVQQDILVSCFFESR